MWKKWRTGDHGDLVHSKDKLLQFTEKVTGEDGQVIGYLCANIEEQNLRYDYLEDPSNQELGQIELIEDGRIIAAQRAVPDGQ